MVLKLRNFRREPLTFGSGSSLCSLLDTILTGIFQGSADQRQPVPRDHLCRAGLRDEGPGEQRLAVASTHQPRQYSGLEQFLHQLQRQQETDEDDTQRCGGGGPRQAGPG